MSPRSSGGRATPVPPMSQGGALLPLLLPSWGSGPGDVGPPPARAGSGVSPGCLATLLSQGRHQDSSSPHAMLHTSQPRAQALLPGGSACVCTFALPLPVASLQQPQCCRSRSLPKAGALPRAAGALASGQVPGPLLGLHVLGGEQPSPAGHPGSSAGRPCMTGLFAGGGVWDVRVDPAPQRKDTRSCTALAPSQCTRPATRGSAPQRGGGGRLGSLGRGGAGAAWPGRPDAGWINGLLCSQVPVPGPPVGAAPKAEAGPGEWGARGGGPGGSRGPQPRETPQCAVPGPAAAPSPASRPPWAVDAAFAERYAPDKTSTVLSKHRQPAMPTPAQSRSSIVQAAQQPPEPAGRTPICYHCNKVIR